MTSEMPSLIALFATAYVAGSINFSILAFRLSGRDDPRCHGSNNPGATNIYRQAGPLWAALVLLLDIGRAMAVAAAAVAVLPLWQTTWVGLGLIMGNHWPVFHGFKGGKGVANYLGFTIVIAPVWAGIGVLAWGAVYLFRRPPFLSSFAMVFTMTAGTIIRMRPDGCGGMGALATALFIVGCHHRNIRERWGRKG